VKALHFKRWNPGYGHIIDSEPAKPATDFSPNQSSQGFSLVIDDVSFASALFRFVHVNPKAEQFLADRDMNRKLEVE
jgi:hypothetical protein